jgi:penicillin-binding protein 2
MRKIKLGKAFADNVTFENWNDRRHPKEDPTAWWLGSGRILIFIILFTVSFFTLFIRLFDLTIIRGHRYRVLADENRTRELIRHASRGNLLDRTGKPLTQNVPSFRLLLPCANGNVNDSRGACIQHVPKDVGEKMLKAGLPPGTFLEVDYVRKYIEGQSIAQVVGYTGEITGKELTDNYYAVRRYRGGDHVGRFGAEAVYEDKLRGRDGKELVEVDSHGTILRTLGRDNEIPGADVTLSLDIGLSHVAASAMPKNVKGAVIVSRPDTGEILALYSSPTFDPNLFSESLTPTSYSRLLSDPNQPLFNRAIGGVYPPGSTFKIITSITALEEGAVTRDTTFEDTGVITEGAFSFANWYFTQYGKTEGAVNIVKALQRSNDIYFYLAGAKAGITKIAKWAKSAGVGKPLGIELPGESSGLMPDIDWKNNQFTSPADIVARNNDWYTGDTYHVAIGQGYLLTTPLQVNAWTNIIANGGKLCRPTIEKVHQTKSGNIAHSAECHSIGISQETLDTISEGMEKACDTGGTAWPLFNFGVVKGMTPSDSFVATSSANFIRVPLACKTGSAEFGDANNNTHAWFTVYGPIPNDDSPNLTSNKQINGDPEISVTVLVEGGGEGSSVAAPVAKQILQEWFSR